MTRPSPDLCTDVVRKIADTVTEVFPRPLGPTVIANSLRGTADALDKALERAEKAEARVVSLEAFVSSLQSWECDDSVMVTHATNCRACCAKKALTEDDAAKETK
jgi:glucosamine 6-phosphate synthetase-like amidotransferase/phosphosugar isomerase protein